MQVAVAGAGIAGLTAAIALAGRGFAVDVYERAPALQEIGAGIQLSPNAMAVLERLGVAAMLGNALFEPAAVDIRDAESGRPLAALPLGAAVRRRYGAPYCVIHRADLQAGLLATASRKAEITLHLGHEVADVHGSESGVSFRAGGETRRADVLVAADGVHSRIRRRYFGHAASTSFGCTAWRATVPAAMAPGSLRLDATGLWLGAGGHLVHYPIQRGASLNVVVIADGESDAPVPPKRPFGRMARRLIDAVPAWTPWPLAGVDPTRRWARERVALIGDAAHAMAPSAAQGGAQAIEDAWVLAAELARKPAQADTALIAYERVRRPRVERVAAAARRNLRIYDLSGTSAAARNFILEVLPARLLLSRLDWLFGWRPE
jgi:salicylate hydroxylase